MLLTPMKKVKITQGYETLVSDCDFERVSEYKWGLARRGRQLYVAGRIDGRKKVYLHRFITDCPHGIEVDHRDFDGLNNTRENLRICSRSENARNTRKRRRGQYKGVYRHSKNRAWIAEICVQGKGTYLGSFKTEKQAALAYNDAARIAFGEFALLNPI